MPDVYVNYPFLNEDVSALTDGSFLGSTTEDGFMSHIWRLRRWGLYGVVNLENGVDVYEVLNLPDPEDAGYIDNGANNYPGEETDAFGPDDDDSHDDILTQWRKTRDYAPGEIIDEGTGERSPTKDIWWGPRGAYDTSGGLLDSVLYIEKFPNGDISFELSSDPSVFDVDYRLSDAFLTFDPDGDNVTVPLYETDDATYFFSGEFVLMRGASYWPWVIDGDDTYNTTTGVQELSPTRADTNGYPLIFFCTQA